MEAQHLSATRGNKLQANPHDVTDSEIFFEN